ncbi:hypothetical protein E0L36_23690 [Streptomyces sp. AJS327]|nr:hypothetical protein [Streptomyces sp. AJS327]
MGLADAVRGVRAELAAAQAEGAEQDLGFEVGPVELEFAVDVRQENTGEARARVYVLSLGAKGVENHGATHRMKVTLNPKDRQGNTPRISSQADSIPTR